MRSGRSLAHQIAGVRQAACVNLCLQGASYRGEASKKGQVKPGSLETTCVPMFGFKSARLWTFM